MESAGRSLLFENAQSVGSFRKTTTVTSRQRDSNFFWPCPTAIPHGVCMHPSVRASAGSAAFLRNCYLFFSRSQSTTRLAAVSKNAAESYILDHAAQRRSAIDVALNLRAPTNCNTED